VNEHANKNIPEESWLITKERRVKFMRFKIFSKIEKNFFFDDRHCIHHFENGDEYY
jgi:hypothetical protein